MRHSNEGDDYMKNPGTPKTAEEAIFDMYSRMISMETTIRGTPNTKEGGLVQTVQEVKNLAVEVKDYYIEQGKTVTWLTARCNAFHGESGHIAEAPSGSPPGGQAENPLSKIPKGRVAAFIASIALFVALVIYNLGGLVGWWSIK
jgi:hypothetical protein